MAFNLNTARKAIYRRISLNSGGFSSPEAEAIRKAFDQILGDLDTDLPQGNFTVANLPTAGTEGRIAYATDGRKAGETAGNGTGVLVFDDGTNWIAADSGAAVAA